MIFNLTQHAATPEQKDQGVIDFDGQDKEQLKALLTFNSIPSKKEIEARAHDLALLCMLNNFGDDDEEYIPTKAMIGGAPFLMSALESALLDAGIQPVYAFSERVSEEKMVNGKVVKTNVFKHLGFV